MEYSTQLAEIKDFSSLFHSGISEKLSLWVDLSELINVFNYLGFFPKLTLVFHVSWYVSLSSGIARQLQTTPVVFPFLYQTGEMLSDADYLGPAFHLSARVGYQISCPQISYPEKDTIQSWTVGTFLEKKENK